VLTELNSPVELMFGVAAREQVGDEILDLVLLQGSQQTGRHHGGLGRFHRFDVGAADSGHAARVEHVFDDG